MIICYEGTPGSGKSYDAVKKILDNLKRGRKVYTNIDGMGDSAKREYIIKLLGFDDLALSINFKYFDRNDEKLFNFWEHMEQGSIMVLDEAQNYFGNRDWQTDKNKAFCKWASTHRHYGYDVILITQDFEKIDSHVRTLVEWTYRYRKMNFFGSVVKNKYIVYAFAGEPSGKSLSKHIRTYDHRVFFCYESYVSKDIKELKIQSHINILKHPIFYAVPVMFLIFFFFFMKSGFSKGEIIPGSYAAIAATKKHNIVSDKPAIARSKPVIIEYKDLMNNNINKPIVKPDVPSNVFGYSQSEKPFVPVPKKVGRVVLFKNDVIETSKDIFSEKVQEHTPTAGMGSPVMPAARPAVGLITVPFNKSTVARSAGSSMSKK